VKKKERRKERVEREGKEREYNDNDNNNNNASRLEWATCMMREPTPPPPPPRYLPPSSSSSSSSRLTVREVGWCVYDVCYEPQVSKQENSFLLCRLIISIAETGRQRRVRQTDRRKDRKDRKTERPAARTCTHSTATRDHQFCSLLTVLSPRAYEYTTLPTPPPPSLNFNPH